MTINNRGKIAKVAYVGTLDDGTVFDSTENHGKPIEFVVGDNQVIDGFDEALYDMEVGETRTVHIPKEKAFGDYDEELIRVQLLDDLDIMGEVKEGDRMIMYSDAGPVSVLIKEIMESGYVVLDFNNKMAGHDLNYELTLLEIRDRPRPKYEI